jgi:hypothetical protein
VAGEKPFEVQGEMLKQISQSLLEMKKLARSLENSALALEPLANGTTRETLASVSDSAKDMDTKITYVYRSIAREAAQI